MDSPDFHLDFKLERERVMIKLPTAQEEKEMFEDAANQIMNGIKIPEDSGQPIDYFHIPHTEFLYRGICGRDRLLEFTQEYIAAFNQSTRSGHLIFCPKYHRFPNDGMNSTFNKVMRSLGLTYIGACEFGDKPPVVNYGHVPKGQVYHIWVVKLT